VPNTITQFSSDGQMQITIYLRFAHHCNSDSCAISA